VGFVVFRVAPDNRYCVPDGWARLAQTVRIVAAASLMAILQMGCALFISDPPEPGIEPPAKYREAAGVPKGFTPEPDWWRAFRSAELNALVERARTGNYDIAAAVARIEQAESQMLVSFAQLLPAGGVSHRRATMRSSARATDGSVDFKFPNVRNHRLGLSASYEVDFWGKNSALVLAADRAALASEYNRDVVELSVVATLVNT